jgi:hypothetical protein
MKGSGKIMEKERNRMGGKEEIKMWMSVCVTRSGKSREI